MLETNRLKIRLLNEEDYKILYPLHSNPLVMKYIREPDQSIQQTQKRMNDMLVYNKKNPKYGLFPAFEKETGKCIGWAILIHAQLDESKEMEVGYRLFPEFWGKGYASELAGEMIKYGQDKGLKSICGVTRPDNLASRRVLEKCKMTFIDEREFYGQMCSYYRIEK